MRYYKRTMQSLSLNDIKSSITTNCTQSNCSIEYDGKSILLQAICKKLTERFVELSYFKLGVFGGATRPFNKTKTLRVATANIAAALVLCDDSVSITCYVTDLDVYGMELYDRDTPSIVRLAEPQFFDIIYNIIDRFIKNPSIQRVNHGR